MVSIARELIARTGLWLLVSCLTLHANAQVFPSEFFDCACGIHAEGQLEHLVLNDRIVEQHPSLRSSVIDPAPRMLVIRVDFEDLPGPPKSGTLVLDREVITKVGATVSDYFEEVSYGKVSLSLNQEDVTSVLRLPKTAEHYASSPLLIELMPAAYRAAKEAGHTLEDYRFIGIVFSHLGGVPDSKVSYHGWAYIGGSTSWYNGSFDPGIVAHELGHSLGLNHANRWQASDSSNPIDPNGRSIEYGDFYDLMGNVALDDARSNHFNPASLSQLGWLPASAIRQVSRNGLFRLYRFDRREADPNRLMAVEVPINATQSYWIGYRHKVDRLRDGVVVVRSDGRGDPTQLLDLKPGGDARDVALGSGQSFVDSDLGLVLSVGRTGGSDGNEYVEFTVKMVNQTAEVAPPVISFQSSTHFITEDADHVVLTLVRDLATDQTVTVDWATVPGTASDQDFEMASGQVSWAAGDPEDKDIAVTIFADDVFETNERFTVVLSNPSGALLNGDTANVSIIDVPPKTAVDEETEAPNENTTDPATPAADEDISPDGSSPEDEATPTDPSLPSTPNVDQSTENPSIDPPATTADDDPADDDPADDDPADDPAANSEPETDETSPVPDLAGPDVVDSSETESEPEADDDAPVPDNGPTRDPVPPGTDNTQGDTESLPGPLPPDGIPQRPAIDQDPPSEPGGDEPVPDDQSAGTTVETGVIWDLGVQADGRLLIGGDFAKFQGTEAKGFAEVLPGGDVRILGRGENTQIRSVAPLADGSTLLAGQVGGPDGTQSGYLAKLLSNGEIDSTFQLGISIDGLVRRVVVEHDGALLVAGDFGLIDGHVSPGVARLHGDGTVDVSFWSPFALGARIADVVVMPGGAVIVAGRVSTPGQALADNDSVSQLAPDGELERVFGFAESVTRIALQPDGKIIVGGQFASFAAHACPSLVRLSADGIIDRAFLVNLGEGISGSVNDLLVQPDGRLVVLGEFDRLVGHPCVGVGRLLLSGALDESWDTGLSLDPGSQVGASVELNASGDLVMGLTSLDRSQWWIESVSAGLDGQALSGWVSFGVPLMTVASGKAVAIPVTRVSGHDGEISVRYAVHKLGEQGLREPGEVLAGEVQWADGDASTKIVRWQAPDIASSWDRFEWQLTAASNAPHLGIYRSLIVERQHSNTRQAWRLEQFGEAVSEDLAFSHEVDFDQDSVSNLIEYALGRSPRLTVGSDGPQALPVIGVMIQSSDGKPYLFIDLDLPSPARDDLIYEVCASDGGASEIVIARKVGRQQWDDAGSGAELIEQAQRPFLSNGRQSLRVVDTQHLGETDRRFLFLRVVLN